MSIRSNPAFSRQTGANNELGASPVTGAIEFTATDGSNVSFIANPTERNKFEYTAVLIDIESTSVTDIPIVFDSCLFDRDSLGEQHTCLTDEPLS